VIKKKQEEKSTPGGGSPGGIYRLFRAPGPPPGRVRGGGGPQVRGDFRLRAFHAPPPCASPFLKLENFGLLCYSGEVMPETAETPAGGTAEGSTDEKFLIFSIQGKYFTIPSRLVGEIALFDTVYPLPLMPGYVLGIINRYSVPYVLFDVGLLLLNTAAPQGKVLVFKDEIDRIAFLIDDVTDIADVPRERLLPVERSADSTDLAEMISASFKWHDADVFVLDTQRLLNYAAFAAPG
jgi:purine-binding chemotaxis protein CheW